ncbi:MAG TPA: serine hydrolase [Candidatus Limnocylindrales bacterium]|nr:serine hydrolase [Candidatus Limnocylindrales bacterium]
MPDKIVDVEPVAALVRSRLKADHIPGLSVAVVNDRQARWLAGFGACDLASRTPAQPCTPYLWFSMTNTTRYRYDTILEAIAKLHW